MGFIGAHKNARDEMSPTKLSKPNDIPIGVEYTLERYYFSVDPTVATPR